MRRKGETLLLRGMYAGRPTYAQSVRVVKDTPEETALAIWPGAECTASAGYSHHRHAVSSTRNRWQETMSDTFWLEKFYWRENCFLILLEPEKYYSITYIWEAASGDFLCYYMNFQIPFCRTRLGFDTLDLDLDFVIQSSYDWQWKDLDEYQQRISGGRITTRWVEAVERARQDVIARLSKRCYPLDGAWLEWKPDPAWTPPRLPPDRDSQEWGNHCGLLHGTPGSTASSSCSFIIPSINGTWSRHAHPTKIHPIHTI